MQARTRQEPRVSQNILRKLTLTSVIAALYALLVVVFAPISFSFFQVRVADALMPLAILFGWPAAIGLGLGALVGNVAGVSLGLPSASVGLDMIGGSITNLVAGLLAWRLGLTLRRYLRQITAWALACLSETLLVAIIVGTYIPYVYGFPDPIMIYGVTISPLLVSILGVLFGSLV
ncbi:MAG TPA: QueT transporter family protein, partial [Candidatus Binatus sp.]|nr:QueT transporter family protein [Candidatus Binatus sp.]